MKNISRILSVLSAAAVTAAVISGTCILNVRAADTTVYNVGTLAEEGRAKALGRTSVTGNILSSYWSGSGFEINIEAEGGNFTVEALTNEKIYLAVFVDGTQLERGAAITSEQKTLTFEISPGSHTVRIVRDTQISTNAGNYFFFQSIAFAGEVLEAPVEKEMYVEIIGDSIACGDGALGVYTPGKAWQPPEDDSAVCSFGYYLAEMLNADYSIVARGGIGLLKDTSGSQESSGSTKITMDEIYGCTNGYADMQTSEGKYAFERKPDLIILELGANDSNTYESQWQENVVSFIEQIHSKNGNEVPIVWVGKNNTHYGTMQTLLRTELKGKNVYAFQYTYGGSGSAALATQTSGHPSAAEQKAFAENILRFLKEKELDKPLTAEITLPAEEDDTPGTATSGKKMRNKTVILCVIGGVSAAAAITCALIYNRKRKNKRPN